MNGGMRSVLEESPSPMEHALGSLLGAILNLPSTRWDSLFAHYSLNTPRKNVEVVSPRFGTRSDTGTRKKWDRNKAVYVGTTVDKVDRQGMFDNVHIAPAMDYQGATAYMAPICSHDCLHIHWRWGASYTEKPQLGWAGGKPYQKAGAPMIPENQSLFISTSGSTTSYAPVAASSPAGTWQMFMHHGTGYVTSLTWLGTRVTGIDTLEFHKNNPSLEEFYYHNRMWETGGSNRSADIPRLNESAFAALEAL
jgi:hypothetical protein